MKRILGFWYSHCGLPESLLRHSLQQLDRAVVYARAQDLTVDILCSVWTVLPFCSFPQLVWPHHHRHALNILCQIKGLSALAQSGGASLSEFACTLEHDVLYPESYFVDVAAAASADSDILCNAHYIGMKQSGFQSLVQQDRPMHQTAFRLPYLMRHLERRISGWHLAEAQYVEPHRDEPHTVFRTRHPAVHVNTSVFLTSHFNVFSVEATPSNPYWGHYLQWYPNGEQAAR